jgi:FMN phosphatase YigB (HAD superfamily)
MTTNAGSSGPLSTPRAVFLDVGETILDETRMWAAWADWLGVTRLTFFALLGVVIERRQHHREVFHILRPGMDFEQERQKMRAAGGLPELGPRDLYPDAVPCLEALGAAGLRVGLVGNQPAGVEDALRELGLRADVVASSGTWGVEKPDPAFFARVVESAGVPAAEICYVGDRVDNDILPAAAAGMVTAFLRRGPWGLVHAAWPEAERADIRLDSLDQLLPALRAL